MATRHRKDMTQMDFYWLARFCHALTVVAINNQSPFLVLGIRTSLFPTWFIAAGVWKLAGYKEYSEPAIGISRNHMQTVCDFIGIDMKAMLELLYRFSMLAVIPGSNHTDPKPLVRMPFNGIPPEYFDFDIAKEMTVHVKGGFVIEKRRAMGEFRKLEKGSGHDTGITYP